MAEVRLQIPDELVKKLQGQLNGLKITDIARDALTLFNWAVEERAKGRLVLSSDDQGGKLIRLTMPSLDQVSTNIPIPE